MGLRVAINGFGRIGRLTLRALLEKKNIEVVAVNDLVDTRTLAHLFKFDTVHGRYHDEVIAKDSIIKINDYEIKIYNEKDPTQLPWRELKVDVVLECSGIFTEKEKAALHLDAGAKKVIISAPAKGAGVKTIVLGVNGDGINNDDHIISNASCTTNCLVPMVKVLDDNWGVESGVMTTIHAYTADQNLQDGPHRDLRRARSAANNVVPTSTGAAKSIGLVMPHLNGKMNGMAMRVPVADGSITDLTCVLKNTPTEKQVNEAFREAASNGLKGILEYSEEEIVSSDIIGNKHSCIFDAPSTMIVGNQVKIVGWYDNEAGYSQRLADLTEKMRDYITEGERRPEEVEIGE